jgi:hypothetical protein
MSDANRHARLLGVLKTITAQPLPADDDESLFETGI